MITQESKRFHELSQYGKYNDAYRAQWRELARGGGERRVYFKRGRVIWTPRGILRLLRGNGWNARWASNPGLNHRAAVYRSFGPVIISRTATRWSDGMGDESVLFPNAPANGKRGVRL